MVLSNVPPAVMSDNRQPLGFWSQKWVQNVLPLATSVFLHAALIGIGIALFQAVRHVQQKSQDQVIIPEMARDSKAEFRHGIVPSSIEPIEVPAMPDLTPSDRIPAFDAPPGGSGEQADPFAGPKPPAGPGTGLFETIGPGSGNWRPGPGTNDAVDIQVGGPKDHSHGSGHKVIYLCDASGSMLGVFGALKQHMKESIADLSVAHGHQFNVIFFSDSNAFPLFKDGVQIATEANKQLAMNFIDNAVSTGGTQPLPAIKMAMAQKPDLIFVLTDGFDQISNFDDVINAFKSGNRDGRMHINTIFLQADEDPKLEQVLKQISADGNGSFLKVLKSDM